MQSSQTLLYLVAAVLILIGLAGVVLPALPGLPLVFAGMLLAAWADGFQQVGWGVLTILGMLTMLSLLADFWATAVGAKRVGASTLAVTGALLGTLVGLFFGPIGIFAAPFVGALLGELVARRRLDRRNLGDATKIGLGTWLGLLFGTVLKLSLACVMLGLFAFAWFL